MPNKDSLVPDERIESLILLIRGEKVILDRDLADLYGVSTAALNQARRNRSRFPQDFMFQLSKEEFTVWMSQVVISNPRLKMGARSASTMRSSRSSSTLFAS